MRRMAIAGLALAGLLWCSNASASSGQISNAFAKPDWSRASFSVSVSGTQCPSTGKCSWFPAVTAQPTLPEYRCLGDEAIDSDPNTVTSWIGPSSTVNSSQSAVVSNAPILTGVYGQRLCLSIVGTTEHVNPVCEAQKKTIEEFTGKPAAPCPLETFIFAEDLAGVFLQVEPPPPSSLPAPTGTPTTSSPAKKGKRRCSKSKRRVIRKGKVRCVKRRKALSR